ncbi:MAG: hypothetical protein J0I84_12360 [Terrimonas sp.]|nr:hypothetical protein [Terrimonas sp.]OJY99621.1 MAG: hypothetical protein BGP13_06085 [Sphingobacteriales bacterium 40-81]
MKKRLCVFILCITHFSLFSQAFPPDAELLAHSQKWKIKLHRPMFGMAKPELGPYITTNFEKLDSPVLRKRIKESSYIGGEGNFSGGWDWDISRYETVEKRKAYRMIVVAETDSTEMLFSIYRISQEKNLTFLGELLSKNDEGKNVTLGFKTNISGILATGVGLPLRFLIYDSTVNNNNSYPGNKERITGWYLLTGNDSLYTEPVMTPGKVFSDQGVFVKDGKDKRIAALKFGVAGNLSFPYYAWIRNDIEPDRQHAIASLFALMVSVLVKD